MLTFTIFREGWSKKSWPMVRRCGIDVSRTAKTGILSGAVLLRGIADLGERMKKSSFLLPSLMYDKETFMVSIFPIANPIRKATSIGGERADSPFIQPSFDFYSSL